MNAIHKERMYVSNINPVLFAEYGPMDNETVISGAAANDQTECKQCKFPLLLFSMDLTFVHPVE